MWGIVELTSSTSLLSTFKRRTRIVGNSLFSTFSCSEEGRGRSDSHGCVSLLLEHTRFRAGERSENSLLLEGGAKSDSSLLLGSLDMIQENIVQVEASHLPEAH